MSPSQLGNVFSTGSGSGRPMIKLAPSPKDVPHVQPYISPTAKSLRPRIPSHTRQEGNQTEPKTLWLSPERSKSLSSNGHSKHSMCRDSCPTDCEHSGPSKTFFRDAQATSTAVELKGGNMSDENHHSPSPQVNRSKKITHRSRSKRIAVIDPTSGEQCVLEEDNHSLTNKDLLVFHRNNAPGNASVAGHSLSTASQLTEVTYGNGFQFKCFPGNCIGVQGTNFAATKLGVIDEHNDVSLGDQKGLTAAEKRNNASTLPGLRFLVGVDERDDVEDGGRDQAGLARSHVDARDAGSLPDFMSAIETIGSLVSPKRMGSFARSFFPDDDFSDVDSAYFDKNATREDVRVPFIIQPGDLLAGGNVAGMMLVQGQDDGQARVKGVTSGSRAERAGVKRGDVISFAVALGNTASQKKKDVKLAEKLTKRLDSVGMRTSYRELFDLFLSKTTNCRSIGVLIRRRRRPHIGSVSPTPQCSSDSHTLLTFDDDFIWSTEFLQSLTIRCREFEFEQTAPLISDEIFGEGANTLSLLDRPKSVLKLPAKESSSIKSFDLATINSNFASAMGLAQMCFDLPHGTPSRKRRLEEHFLDNRVLCSLVEQAVGLIFVRRNDFACSVKGAIGTGIAVARLPNGSWSAPCFIVLADRGDNRRASDQVNLIVVRSKDYMNKLISGGVLKIAFAGNGYKRKPRGREAVVVAMDEGNFFLVDGCSFTVRPFDKQNQRAYRSSGRQISVQDILAGATLPPDESIGFFGALHSLESPYAMHAHPVIPEIIQPYRLNDWEELSSKRLSTVVPRNRSINGELKKLLESMEQGHALEGKREVNIFSRKFKHFLMDGVPVKCILPSVKDFREDKVLRLLIKDNECVQLELSRKRRPGLAHAGDQGSFVTTLENITKVSRTCSPALGLNDDEKRRFFSFESDLSGGPKMMLTKSAKDATLLLCGLKLLLEMGKVLSSD